MAELDVLKKALNDGLFVPILPKGVVRLSEKGSNAKLKRVDLEGIDIEAIVLKLDKTRGLDSIFKGGDGQLKRCDYLVLTTHDKKHYALFIEMKSRLSKDNKYILQFKGAESLMDYIESILNRFYKQNNLLSKYEKRFALLYKLPINKTRTRPAKLPKNYKPEKALECEVDDFNQLSFRELIIE